MTYMLALLHKRAAENICRAEVMLDIYIKNAHICIAIWSFVCCCVCESSKPHGFVP